MKVNDIKHIDIIDNKKLEKLEFYYNQFVGWLHKDIKIGFDRKITIYTLNGFIILAKLIQAGLVEKVEEA